MTLISCCLCAAALTTPTWPSKPFKVEAVPLPAASVTNFSAWSQVPSTALMPCGGRFIYRNETRVRFAWTADALCFFFEAKDDDVLHDAPARTDQLFCFGDTVELFVKRPEERSYWEFHFAASGRNGAIRFPSRGKRMPWCVKYLPFEGLVQKTEIDGTLNDDTDRDRGWRAIVCLPWKSLGVAKATAGDRLRVQVASVAYSLYADGDEKSHLYSRDGAQSDPHALEDWCELELKP